MDLVVDANVLFSALIRDGKTIEILLDRTFHVYAPDFIFEEFEKHKSHKGKKGCNCCELDKSQKLQF